ncbi:hypothetical protein BBO99_00005874 [Phytophthora kernoviae]|uniref:GED domain-containing protein n=2 Tax=Phytophthora kernoviae TaxID=325452 RepID=A0A3R7GBY0_9STRA|nr:hypothetical protein G195_006551 [Phytophthora kernoviae 00238/432]KAG2524293.1 hypothetical protein JM18_005163 [Phytophthora kernoviae]RLN45721.1 hypothetical protein BBI17_005906 [Phytophthora kernoviae]RLN78565.1 hypothetical protein BBO99_00005874 [Phytophthora kernoviae]
MKLKMDHKLFDRLRSDEDQRKLVDKLREIGLDQYVELPQIAVMGDTSSGKSSLLSAISGVSFPSADQLTTRCPTQLILTNADTFRGNVRLVRFQVDNESSTGENLFDTGEDKEALTCLGDVPGAITKLTKKLVDEGQYISDDQIVVEMSGPELPNLTLTDLPGLVRTVGDHEDENIIPRVRNMVNRYMSQERTIIIAVVPANVDMHNTEILQAAQEADPNGTRTIAVVTKVDLVDAGAEQAVHDLLLNKKKKMHLGYHAVKCRSQRELTKGTTIEKGISNEIAFFGKHEYWRRLPTELWGVLELSGRLVTILQDNIRRSLPKVISEINARLAVAQKEVSRIGVPLESLGAQRQQLGKWVNQYLRQIEAVMNGHYVQQTVRTWERPALQLLEHYYTQTTLISHRLAAMVLGDTGNTRVEQFINTTADRVLGVLEAAARQELKLLLQYESRPYTQDQRLYEELDKLRQRALRSRLEEAFPPANAHGLVSLTDVARTLGGVSVGQFTLSSVDREALEMEIALQAYLDVASHRFVDVVPMKLNGMILCSFFREMESEFLSITTDKKVGELLQESDGEAARRQHLFDRINTLEKAKCVIESSVPMPAPFY